MSLFNIIAFAFIIALTLYELTQYLWAHYHRATTDQRIRKCVHTGRLYIDRKAAPRTPEQLTLSLQRTYMSRSLIFHQLNAWLVGAEPDFRTWPYAAMGLMGTALFIAAGLPAITALGIGVVGGITTFVSKQGRDLACFSDEMSWRDEAVKNLNLVLRNERRQRRFA